MNSNKTEDFKEESSIQGDAEVKPDYGRNSPLSWLWSSDNLEAKNVRGMIYQNEISQAAKKDDNFRSETASAGAKEKAKDEILARAHRRKLSP